MPKKLSEKSSPPNDKQILKQLVETAKILNPLNPFQQGVDKAVKKWATDNATEALETTGDVQGIMQKAGLDKTDGAALLTKLMPQNQYRQPPQIQPMQQQQMPNIQMQQPTQQPQSIAPQPMASPTQQPQATIGGKTNGEGDDMSFLRKLMISVGSGMATAGKQPGVATGLLDFISKERSQTTIDPRDKESLIRQRNANSALMEDMKKKADLGETAKTIFRDAITGELTDAETAESDMEKGYGVYQMNEVISTRSGVVEKNLNKIPELTQEEKKYVNDARLMGKSLSRVDEGYEKLYSKYGESNWQSFQIEKIPYFLAQDQDIQDLKSEITYLKAAIPFMRGGKQLTTTEAKRIDVMLNPFGKNKETYQKDIRRFQDEFTGGTDIMKYGINASLMARRIGGEQTSQPQQSKQTLSPAMQEAKRRGLKI